jgi:hypothetical protein
MRGEVQSGPKLPPEKKGKHGIAKKRTKSDSKSRKSRKSFRTDANISLSISVLIYLLSNVYRSQKIGRLSTGEGFR